MILTKLLKNCTNMKLQKKNLHVIGSAPSFEKLSSLIKSHLYWAKVEIKESDYTITNGTLYEIQMVKHQFYIHTILKG